MTDCPRIYVASLSDYNAGRLHGVWIDLDGKTADGVQEEVDAMLLASPDAHTCQKCGQPVSDVTHVRNNDTGVPFLHDAWPGNAEEWAIHDYEGFAGIRLSEWEQFSYVCELAEAILEHGADVVASFHRVYSVPNDAQLDELGERFQGGWESPEEWAQEAVANGLLPYEGEFSKVDTFALMESSWVSFIDWEHVAHEFEIGGGFTFDRGPDYVLRVWADQ